jgi:hypothetical protein
MNKAKGSASFQLGFLFPRKPEECATFSAQVVSTLGVR